MLVAARDAKVARFVYAASSSTYGDHPGLPKVEDVIGKPLSPYAVTKLVNEQYAEVFARAYGFKTIGLRYFNIFGAHQDPDGAYAAVVPKWTSAMIHNEPVFINGDGETSRDFCYIANTVQANLLAATAEHPGRRQPGLQRGGGRPHHPERPVRGHPLHPGAPLPPPGASNPATGTSAPATCAIPWPTSPRPGPSLATSPATASARAWWRPWTGT
jgi:hypothetical protein